MLIKRVFDILDRDGDGLIGFEDFVRGLFPLASKNASQDDKLDFVFQCLDLDGSSSISREDLLVHLHMYASQSLEQHDCGLFCPNQLDEIIAATFADCETDANGDIGREGFSQLVRAQPRLLRELERRLSLNVNKTLANLIIGLDETWLEVGARPPRSSTGPGASAGPAWCPCCAAAAQSLRRCCRPSPRERRRPWDCCLPPLRLRWLQRQEYVPSLVVIVP